MEGIQFTPSAQALVAGKALFLLDVSVKSTMHTNLRTARVALLPLQTDHYPLLHAWHHDPRTRHLWLASRQVWHYEAFVQDFERRLRRSIDLCFVVHSLPQSLPIGLVYSYNTEAIDRTTYLCAYIAPEYASLRVGPSAVQLFVDYLFGQLAFRKLYAEVFEYNYRVHRALELKGFRPEACLHAQRWYQHRYWSVYTWALYAPGCEPEAYADSPRLDFLRQKP